jgi:hypothetical protein
LDLAAHRRDQLVLMLVQAVAKCDMFLRIKGLEHASKYMNLVLALTGGDIGCGIVE